MRWLILTDDHPPSAGGVATWTAAVAEGLRRVGDEVVVYARRREGLPDGVRGVRGRSFGRLGGLWMRLAAGGELGRVDAVLASSWPVASWLPRLEIPVHVVFHGSDLTRPPISARGLRRVLDRASHRWAVSRWLADHVGAEVLPSPVDPLPPRPPPDRAARWGLVARATPLKGGDRFVRLVAAAGVEGIVLGDGPELGRWRALADELGAAVRFDGHVPRGQLPDRLRALDLVLLLPRTAPDGSGGEGLGLALLEAAAVGVPVVGCRTGGVPEAVGPGLVLDDPDDVARSVAAITAWWTPDRGEAQRSWLAERHGVARTVAALRAGSR